MKQQITLLLLALVLLPWTGLSAADATLIGGLKYELDLISMTAKVAQTDNVTGELVIPDEVNYSNVTYKVTSIGDWAFEYNKDITSVTFGKNLLKIGDHSFTECNGLTSLIIPDNVTELGLGAFAGCTKLASIVIGSGITEVVGFEDCPALTSVTLPAGLKSIGEFAFASCVKLAGITLPAGIETIDEEAFERCTALQTLNVPQSLTQLARNAFNGCTSLKSVNVDANNANYSSKNGVVYDKAQTNIHIVPNGITGPVTIPGTVTNVKASAFTDCWSLESVFISEGVTEIGENAFRDCDGMTSLTLPQSLKKIADWGFKGCKALVSVKLPSGLTSLGYNVFTSCDKLASITIPDGITELKGSAFALCYDLAKVTLGSGLEKIDAKVFNGCNSLDTIVIGNSVTTIGEEAFSDCKALVSVTLGNKVSTLEKKAFSNCTNIKELLTLNPVPPTCGEDIFYITIPNNSRLYVPNGKTSAYKEAEVWKNFKKVAELYEDGKKPLTATVTKEGNGSIQINGAAVESTTTVKEGTDVTLAFKPAEGYIFTSVKLDGQEITDKIVNSQYVIKSVRDNFKVTVEFKEGYTVSVTNRDDLGTVKVNGKPAPVCIEKGQPVELTISPSMFYYVDKALLNNQEIALAEENKYTVASIDKNLSFEIKYEEYRLVNTEYNSAQGTVTVNGQQTTSYKARKGEEVKFAINAKEGYKLNTVKLDDRSVIDKVVEGVYTFTIADADSYSYLLTVTFKKYSSIDTTNGNDPAVYAGQGKISIENLPENTVVTVTDSKGQTVYQGMQREIRLDSGLYIVKVGDKTVKVAVQ